MRFVYIWLKHTQNRVSRMVLINSSGRCLTLKQEGSPTRVIDSTSSKGSELELRVINPPVLRGQTRNSGSLPRTPHSSDTCFQRICPWNKRICGPRRFSPCRKVFFCDFSDFSNSELTQTSWSTNFSSLVTLIKRVSSLRIKVKYLSKHEPQAWGSGSIDLTSLVNSVPSS